MRPDGRMMNPLPQRHCLAAREGRTLHRVDFAAIVEHAAARYRTSGRNTYHFARGKLRGDPVYRRVLEDELLPKAGTVLDLGCGGGLMLAALASARALSDVALPPASARRLVGVETRPRAAAIARRALGDEAEILTDDVRRRPLPPARAILLFDVLHMMRAADQDALLVALLSTLEPGGVLLVREADAAAGWRFHVVRAANTLKAWLGGASARDFHFRSCGEWRRWLELAGLAVETHAMGLGTPFGNVLLVGRKGA